MSEPAIAVEGLGKQYFINHQRSGGDGISHAIESAIRSPLKWLRGRGSDRTREEFWALRDVTFSIQPGEAVGVVGRNGAGKSTLLKLLSRITEPTRGSIRYKGRVSSLLEVGTGFHPDLSGRENIYLNAAILGMPRNEIARKFDEIVAFSEIERFLDTPVKRYSSGMYVRLAFSVAAYLEPDILIVDEVLAVGDAAFQKKCLGKIGGVVGEGRTVLLVSHNMAAINFLCNRAMLIDGGRLVESGPPQAIVDRYLAISPANADVSLTQREDRKGDGRIRFSKVTALNTRGEEVQAITSGQDLSLAFDVDIPGGEPLHNVVIQIKFFGTMGQPLFACLSSAASSESRSLAPGQRVHCHIPRLPLMPGTYTYTIWCEINDMLADFVREAGRINVVEGDFFGTGKLPLGTVGDFLVSHTWS